MTSGTDKDIRSETLTTSTRAFDVLLASIHVVGTLCVGIAGSNNRLVQDHLTSGSEDILDLLVDVVVDEELEEEEEGKCVERRMLQLTTEDQSAEDDITQSAAPRFHTAVRIEAACAVGCLALGNKQVNN